MKEALTALLGTPASATIMFSPTNSHSADEQTIQFELPTIGPSLTGDTNTTVTPIVLSR